MTVIVPECCVAFLGERNATFDFALALAPAVALRGAAERGALCAPSCRRPERSEGGTSWGGPNQSRRRASVASRGPSAPQRASTVWGAKPTRPSGCERQTRANAQAKPERKARALASGLCGFAARRVAGVKRHLARGTGVASGGTVARGRCGSNACSRPTGRPSSLSKLGLRVTRSVNVRTIRKEWASNRGTAL